VLAKSAVAPWPSANEILIGMSAAFRGSAAVLCASCIAGPRPNYSESTRGGVIRRSISLVALDYAYNPELVHRKRSNCSIREKGLLPRPHVGTPTLTRALPVITQYADQTWSCPATSPRAAPSASTLRHHVLMCGPLCQDMQALVEPLLAGGSRRPSSRLLPGRLLRPHGMTGSRGPAGPQRP